MAVPDFRAVLESWPSLAGGPRTSGRIRRQVIEQLREYASVSAPATAMPGREVLDRAFQAFRRMFDARLGGFGAAPKFPRPSIHNFLLRYYAETGTKKRWRWCS